MSGLSTALSDAVLGGAALLAAWGVAAADSRPTRRLAGLGFLLLACAAGLGALRHGLLPVLESWHRLASAAAAMVGMPLVVGALLTETRPAGADRWTGLGVLLLVLLWAAWHDSALWRLLAGLLTQLLWLVIAWHWLTRSRAAAGWVLLAVAVTLFAGLVVGNQGAWRGLARLDLLHYLLALAQLALLAAIRAEARSGRSLQPGCPAVAGAAHG